jgi:hypothetical protein
MRFRNLERYKTGRSDNNIRLGIPLPKTPDGRVYRYSPNENAHPGISCSASVEGFGLPEEHDTPHDACAGHPRNCLRL